MFNMPLGSGLYANEDQQQASPFALGSGLYGQQLPPQLPQVDNAPDAAGAIPVPGGGEDKFTTLLNNPMFQMGMNLLGNARNRQGGLSNALASTLAAQYQGARAKREQALTNLEGQRIGLEAAKGQREQQSLEQVHIPLAQAQIGNYGSEAQQREALVNLESQKTEQLRQQLARQGAIGELIMNKMGGGGGGGTAPANPAPQNIGPAASAIGGDVGRYGTPTAILDNLQRTESSGNPNAMGPVLPNGDRAMGAYQFTPQTVAMMKAQGHPFNPMDGGQSRDAADFYLQQLLQKNGGDWNKALAAYGGFATKDPSQYINKVMQGVSLPGTATSTQPVAGGVPMPASAMGNANDVGQMGMLMGMGGMPGASQIMDYAKQLIPQTTPAGSLKVDSNGNVTQLPNNPLDIAKYNLESQKVQNEGSNLARNTAKTEQEMKQVDVKRAETQAKDTQAYQTTMGSLGRLKAGAQALLTHPGLEANTGWYGALGANKIPNSKGQDASTGLDTLQSRLFVDTISDMKAASANGSTGFGQLSDREGDNARTVIVNLKRAQSLPAMQKALKDAVDFADQAQQRYTQHFQSLYKDGGPGVSALGPNQGAAAPAQAEQPISLDEYLQKRKGGR